MLGGGSASGATHNDVWSTSDGSNWKAATLHAQWSPRQHHAACVFKGRLWLAGGYGYSGATSQNESFNDVWASSDGKLWELVQQHAAWVPRNQFVMLAVPLPPPMRYNVTTFTPAAATMPSPSSSPLSLQSHPLPPVVALEESLVVLAGNNFAANAQCHELRCLCFADVWRSANGTNWLSLHQEHVVIPWGMRSRTAAVVTDSSLFIMGGAVACASGQGYADVWAYNTSRGVRPHHHFPPQGPNYVSPTAQSNPSLPPLTSTVCHCRHTPPGAIRRLCCRGNRGACCLCCSYALLRCMHPAALCYTQQEQAPC